MIYQGKIATCRICDKKKVECCFDGNCRECHVSVTWEDCMDQTWNVDIMRSRHSDESLREMFPHAKQWRSNGS